MSLSAQLIIDSNASVEALVEQQLIGPGISISQISFNGQPANEANVQVGYFDASASNVGIEQGLILSNGMVTGAIGPNSSSAITLPEIGLNQSGDTDLSTLADAATYDAAVIEFDFVPTGDSLVFEFVFASDEYPEFSNDQFNDVFGFFLSGPGISGPYSSPAGFPDGSKNIALLPNTETPISINSVNNGYSNQGDCLNCEYYNANGDGFTAPQDADPSVVQYDGILVPIQIKAAVQCGETYHIKLAIADVVDDGYDSAIFLAAHSFQTNDSYQAQVLASEEPGLAPNLIVEGCYPVDIAFSRSTYWTQTSVLNISTSGSVNPTDDLNPIPSQLSFDQASSSHILSLSAVEDELSESSEDFYLRYTRISCGQERSDSLLFEIHDRPQLTASIAQSGVGCFGPISLQAEVSGALGDLDYLWSDGSTAYSTLYNALSADNLSLSIGSICAETVQINLPIEANSLNSLGGQIPEALTLSCGENQVLISPTLENANIQSSTWTLNGNIMGQEVQLNTQIDQSGDLMLEVSDGCGNFETFSVAITHESYTPLSIVLPSEITACQGEEMLIIAEVTGGQAPLDFEWSHGDSDGPELLTQLDEGSQIALYVTDHCGLSAMATGSLFAQPIVADFILEESDANHFYPMNLSSANNPQGLDYQWYVDGQWVAAGANGFQQAYMHNGAHEVSLELTDPSGCADIYTAEISPSGRVFVPTAFSPDGDQINESFDVKGVGLTDYHLIIYDRRGTMVFESTDLDLDWDGHVNLSQDAIDSHYNYSIRAISRDGSIILKSGVVSVLH